MNPDHTGSPSFSGTLSHTYAFSLQKKKKTSSPICITHYWSMAKVPVTSPIKITVSPPLRAPPEATNWEELHFSIFITTFKGSLQWLPL